MFSQRLIAPLLTMTSCRRSKKGFGKHVVEDVDFQIHQTVRLNVTLEERVSGRSRARPDARAPSECALPRQAT